MWSYSPKLSCRCHSEFCDFALFNIKHTVKEYTRKSALKSCNLDPLPASVMKNCLDILLPVIYHSLLEPCLMHARVLSCYEPLRNLMLILRTTLIFVRSRIWKWCPKSLKRRWQYIKSLCFYPSPRGMVPVSLQARLYHSTEIALVRVQNDILYVIDSNYSVIPLLLDLSAAFDTVYHSILLERLSDRFGVNGTVLTWFESYLKSRKYYVQVERSKWTTRTSLCVSSRVGLGPPSLCIVHHACCWHR